MSYTYSTFVAALLLEAQIPASNVTFQAQLPTIIDQSEQMIYRDLDLLATIVRDSSGVTTPNSRLFTLPTASGRFVVLESVNMVNGTSRTPLVKTSREVMDMLYPDDTATSGAAVPTRYAPLTDQTILLGPAPGSAINVECIGTIRPAPLSASNTETFLSTQLPDIFFAAAMIFTTGYQQNFGAQADNPKMALSWKDIYAALIPAALGEENRRKYQTFAQNRAA